MATGSLAEHGKDDGASQEQLDAWGFYGLPRGFGNSSNVRRGRQVGEVRYIVGWASDQMSRMGWRVTVDGSEDWRITPPGDGVAPIVSNSKQDDPEEPDHPVNASAELLDVVGWKESTVRQVTTNLYVAGELFYTVREEPTDEGTEEVWEVVSVIHPDRKDLLKRSLHSIRGLYPHPASPSDPDAPIFGVLPILEDMDWLNRLSRSQSSNRVGMRGILGVADGISVANGTGEDFWEDLDAMIHEPMKDPDDVGMAVLRGPAELVEQSGQGMKGLSLLIPDFPYDDKVDARMDKLVQRLAYGLPVPPEVLLGMQAASRATAFQVEEQSYRAHIEPMAIRVAKIPSEALALLLPDYGEIEVVPDPTQILARRHSISDVLEAFDREAVTVDYLRETLGIPPRAKPDEEDLADESTTDPAVEAALAMVAQAPSLLNSPGLPEVVAQIRAVTDGIDYVPAPRPAQDGSPPPVPETDPANDAADEAINAAAAIVGVEAMPATFRRLLSEDIDPSEVTTLSELSEALEHIDATLLAELGGATQMSTERAREKLGAAVRSRATSKSAIPSDLTNAEVAAHMGEEGLAELGVQIETVIEGAIEPLTSWWDSRVTGAQSTITKLLGAELAPEFTPRMVEESSELLTDLMTQHILSTLSSPIAQSLPAARRVEVISVAGGAE